MQVYLDIVTPMSFGNALEDSASSKYGRKRQRRS
jgi:hypothetical protein